VARVHVWDPLVRVFHWAVVASVAVAWFIGDRAVHEGAGYVAGGLVALRLLWGIIGPRYARFAQFIRNPGTTLAYLRDIAAGNERRYLGHNPAGALMIVALLLGLIGTVATGYMMESDAFFGVEWVELLHRVFAYSVLALAAVHVLGVIVASIRHRENLAAAMVTGRKRAATPDDIA